MVLVVRNGQILVAVGVEVPQGRTLSFVARTVTHFGRKEPVSGPEENRDVIATGVGRGEVLDTVFIEVTHQHPSRLIPHWEVPGCGESAGPVAEEDQNIIAVVVCHGEVLVTVPVEVLRDKAPGAVHYTVRSRRYKAAIPVIEKE